jgi:hypothetical protein
MINFIQLAKEAHRKNCPMIDCVDCLFGVCNLDCDYLKGFEKDLMELIKEDEQRNDNKRTL